MRELLIWAMGVYAFVVCPVVVIAAMRQTDSWRIPDRDPVRERREHEELWR